MSVPRRGAMNVWSRPFLSCGCRDALRRFVSCPWLVRSPGGKALGNQVESFMVVPGSEVSLDRGAKRGGHMRGCSIVALTAATVLAFVCGGAHPHDGMAAAAPSKSDAESKSHIGSHHSGGTKSGSSQSLPCQAFSNRPKKPHDSAANFFTFDQLEYNYRVPGEFTY